ncbi:hypothetical protein E1B28_013418 [Marasmius oreades]|uniref:Zn(2)-C6 fungal-type domain-containing protein n=1 Tax=Marasmius oreades TaxID=181124 RepID=A0A9P7UM58_9AGAR|nr:uncharacterized protein E1B28_013418 [Marasmius oreades]KAG7087452.1 hypothetical protein E1B28_013418 [Marasmius oreades]
MLSPRPSRLLNPEADLDSSRPSFHFSHGGNSAVANTSACPATSTTPPPFAMPPAISSQLSGHSQLLQHEPDKPPIRTKRRYGASCELCRRRKRKCPGRDSTGKTLCTHCSEVGVKCVFPPNGKNSRLPKPVPSTSDSSNKEADILRKYIRRLAIAESEERDQMLSQWLKDDGVNHLELSVASLSSRHTSQGIGSDDDDFDSPSARMESEKERARPHKKLKTREGRRSRSPSADESIDQDDSQWRPESAESALRLCLKPATPADSDNSSVAGDDNGRPIPPNQQVSTWVDYYISTSFRMSESEGPTPENSQILLNNYFCWQGPRNSIIDQKVFESAMRENDLRYFSPFLLYAIYTHTIRHVPHLAEKAPEYTAKTHLLLSSALSRPSSIPTIQGMLLLAANHAARGMYAQSWCLTASAIGMIIDLECHLDKPVEDENQSERAYMQRQMRLRVFWAAYNWDKMLSLSLNRNPLLSLEEHYPPLPDPVDCDDLWKPVLSPDSPRPLFGYVPQPCHEAKCFYECCQANQFLDEIHRNLYRKKMRPHHVHEFVSNMRQRLMEWQHKASKAVIRDFEKQSMPPPPHILQLNLLVQLIWILLYRPFYYMSSRDSTKAIPHAVAMCESAAEKISDIFILYDFHYPLGRASYLVIFAAFLAATVDLALSNRQKSGSSAILSRLALASRVLNGGSDNIPGMQSSVQSLQRHLHETMCHYNLDGSPTITSTSSPASATTPEKHDHSPTPPLTSRDMRHPSQSASPEMNTPPASGHIPHPKIVSYQAQSPPHAQPSGVSNGNPYPSGRVNPPPIDTYSSSQTKMAYDHLSAQQHQQVHQYQAYASSPEISLIPPVASYRLPRTVEHSQTQHVPSYTPAGGDHYHSHSRRDSLMSAPDTSQHYSPISPQRASPEEQGQPRGMDYHMHYQQPCNAWFWPDENYGYSQWQSNSA